VLQILRRYDESLAAYKDALALDPDWADTLVGRGFTYYLLGNFESARASCEAAAADPAASEECLAITYDKLGRHADAEVMLAKAQRDRSNAEPYQYAVVYSQWGNRPKALEWLDVAMRVRDPDLIGLKTDPFVDPLRQEPRFQAVIGS
jgi:tetratricopeptide (TPR) repeat protein